MNTKRYALASIILLSVVLAAAGIETLRFGAGNGWEGTVSRGLRQTDGWKGEAALTLSPLGRNPFLAEATALAGDVAIDDIDLLLLAEPSGLENPVGHYGVTGSYDISKLFPARGEASLRPGVGGVVLIPSSQSMWAPGNDWADFTLDFRLRPSTLRNGEIFFSWTGRDADGNPQSIEARVENRRLVWDFRAFFRQGSDRVLNLTLVSPPLIPGEWQHHRIRYNRGGSAAGSSGASPGLLEYLLDGTPSDMVHATRDGREGPVPYTPHIGELSDESLYLAPSFSGYVDEFRLVQAYVSNPPAGGYSDQEASASGRGRIDAVDSFYPGSSLVGVRARVDAPGSTQVRFFAKSMPDQNALADIGMPGGGSEDWIELTMTEEPEDPTGFGRWYSWEMTEEVAGRYFSVGYVLDPDPAADRAPVLSALEMDYEPRLPPRVPIDLQWIRGDDGRIRISWSPDAEEGVAGWWISWGPRPGDYSSIGEDEGIRGSNWVPRVEGDSSGRPEFTWPDSLGNRIIYTSVRAAWAEGADNGSGRPGDYRALSNPTREMSFRP